MILEVQDSLQDVIWGGVDEYFFILLSNNDSWNPETRKKPAPCGSQSSRSSSLCRGARLLLSTPTQFAPVTSCLSSVGFDPIFGCTNEWTADSVHVVPQQETCHGVGWSSTSNSFENMLWFFTVLHLPRMHRVRQEDPHQLERGAASLSFSLHFGSVCIFLKPGKLVPSSM